MTNKPFLVIGLGNPGVTYEHTPHNIGKDFLIFSLSTRTDSGWKSHKLLRAITAQYIQGATRVVYAIPDSYMNDSGRSVKAILRGLRLATDRCVIIHDDSDLVFGNIKLAVDNRSAGHHGIDSVFLELKTRKINRIRVGIRIPTELSRAGTFILRKFNKEQQKNLETAVYPKIQAVLDDLINKSS